MTRKDYEALAKALAESRPPRKGSDDLWQWRIDRYAIASALAADNPLFSFDKFLEATEA